MERTRKATAAIAFALALFLCGCQKPIQNPVPPEDLVKNSHTVTIEGCEYIVYSVSELYHGYGFMAHKGNCKNPIHKGGEK